MANVLIGFIVGAFGGLVGLGGGVIMVPLLVFFHKLEQRKAHGTSLVALVLTGITGAMTYASRGSVDYWAAAVLAVPGVFAAKCGASYCHVLPEWKLKRFFGAFLIFVSVLLLMKPLISASAPLAGAMKWSALSIIGLLSGFLSGTLGIGGGAFAVPAMVLVTGMGQHLAQGTSLLYIIPAGAAGAYSHHRLGNVAVPFVPKLIIGIVSGTVLGAMAANDLPEGFLRVAFAAALSLTGFKYMRFPAPACDPEI